MVRSVYVFTLDLIMGHVADLAGRNSPEDALEMSFDKVNDRGIKGYKVTIVADFARTRAPAGCVRFSCVGRICPGAVEAERTAMTKFVDSLRNTHHLSPVDYSFVAICEKRALFNAMRNVLEPTSADYVQTSLAVKEANDSVNNLCRRLSIWTAKNHLELEREDLIVVSCFHAEMSEQAEHVDSVLRHAQRMHDMIVLRTGYPDGLARFDQNVPMPMAIDWDACFFSLREIFDQAAKRVKGVLINMDDINVGDQFRASVEVTEPSHSFVGDIASTENGALAKLYFAIIKHVNVDLGYSILDFNGPINEYMADYIDRFDRNLKGMVRCVETLKLLIEGTVEMYGQVFFELTQHLQINANTASVIDAVDVCLAAIRTRKARVEEICHGAIARQVDRKGIEASLGINN